MVSKFDSCEQAVSTGLNPGWMGIVLNIKNKINVLLLIFDKLILLDGIYSKLIATVNMS